MSDVTSATTSLTHPDGVVSQRIRVFRLTIRTAGGAERSRELAQPVVRIGSRRGNDVEIDDDSVSRIHCEIVAEADGFRLRDLDSLNGTVVDGYRTRDIYLRSGSRIALGRSQLLFEALERDAEVVLADREQFGPLMGKSAAMRRLFALLERVAPTDFTVLVEGETGTGKDLVARAVHAASRRASGPFVVFDAAAVPEQLVESLLFGHERGAFTGAAESRNGLIREAHGGTLFIDELGELPLHIQPKLLRVLEAREVCPIGGASPYPVDVRVVAATHRDLAAAVNDGSFRDDLYYRLAVVRVVVPPLRERMEEVQMLVEHFVRMRCAGDSGRADRLVGSIEPDSWDLLAAQRWPGNVRQLRNAVDAAIALTGDDLPLRFHLGAGDHARAWHAPEAPAPAGDAPDFERPFIAQRDALVDAFEKRYLTGILERHDGNVSRAAEAAGLDRSYFKRLLRRHR